MKFTTILALVASVAAIRIDGPPAAKPAPLTWNY